MPWVDEVLAGTTQSENELVSRYTQRLLAFARAQLPPSLQRRIDPEDVVQSVYRSFFRRLNDEQFHFDDSHDVWQLLATITYRKSRNAVKHHQRQQRDVRRDHELASDAAIPGHEPGPDDLAVFYDSLQQLLDELPEDYRQLVVFRLEGYSIAEIAERVERSQRTVLRVLAHVRDLATQQIA